jgi:hypothetical protein
MDWACISRSALLGYVAAGLVHPHGIRFARAFNDKNPATRVRFAMPDEERGERKMIAARWLSFRVRQHWLTFGRQSRVTVSRSRVTVDFTVRIHCARSRESLVRCIASTTFTSMAIALVRRTPPLDRKMKGRAKCGAYRLTGVKAGESSTVCTQLGHPGGRDPSPACNTA